VLWTRVTNGRLSAPAPGGGAVGDFRGPARPSWPTSTSVFKPKTDLGDPQLHRNHIIQDNRSTAIVDNTQLQLGNADIGYGLRPDHPCRRRRRTRRPGRLQADELRGVREVRGGLRPRIHRQAHRRAEEQAEALAELYADPEGQGDVLVDHGFNQHTRGVWANNLVYNIHLLTGKIATPGNSPFSLTGQPSACGTRAKSALSATGCRPTWW
jgi:nitrate reductase NapA